MGTGEQVRSDLVDERLEAENVAKKLRFVASVIGDLAAFVQLNGKLVRNSQFDRETGASEITHHVNGCLPLRDCQVDFSGEFVEMPYKTGHDLCQSWMRLRPRGGNDLVNQRLAIFRRCGVTFFRGLVV